MVVISCRSGSTTCVPEIRNGTATIVVPSDYKGQNITVEYRSLIDPLSHLMKQKEPKPPKDYGRVPPRKLKK